MNSDTAIPVSSNQPGKFSPPILFFFFYLPFGIFSGYLSVTLAFLFAKSGVSIQEIAGLSAINLLPQIFKFSWAPIVDTTLSLKKWYLLATLVTAACIFATGVVPINASSLLVFTVMILLCSFARSFISAAIGGLAAHGTSPNLKGRVGGYCQAGNLGGGAAGGGAGLWLAQHTSHSWMPAGMLALVCVLCCAGLFFVNEPTALLRAKSVKQNIANVGKDVWSTLKTKRGLLATILNLLPLGTGAAGLLFAAMAKDWHSGADTVALVTGVYSGGCIIAGCVIGGFICDVVDRQKAFVYFSLLQAACCVGMAFCPHVPAMYIVWSLTYALVNGFVNAGYSSFTLEATGRGAAASKFELYSSMSYLPTYLMFWVSGTSYSKWGASGLLNMEAIIAVAAAAIYFTARTIINRRKSMPADLDLVIAR